jgi:hypothetical protein
VNHRLRSRDPFCAEFPVEVGLCSLAKAAAVVAIEYPPETPLRIFCYWLQELSPEEPTPARTEVFRSARPNRSISEPRALVCAERLGESARASATVLAGRLRM